VKEKFTKHLFTFVVMCTKTDRSGRLERGAVNQGKHKLGPLLGRGEISLEPLLRYRYTAVR